MALYIRPPREIREAAAAGDIERVRKSGLQLQWSGWDPETRRHLFLEIAPLPTGRIAAARQEWTRVIHVIIAQKVVAASARDQT